MVKVLGCEARSSHFIIKSLTGVVLDNGLGLVLKIKRQIVIVKMMY